MNNIDYEAISQRVDRKLVRERNKSLIGLFLANLIIFITFSVMVWVILPLTNFSYSYETLSSANLLTLIMLSIGWLTGLILHGVTALSASGAMNNRLRERLTAQEIERELRQMSHDLAKTKVSEKPKRSYDRLVLSEDGELVEITTDHWEDTLEEDRTRH